MNLLLDPVFIEANVFDGFIGGVFAVVAMVAINYVQCAITALDDGWVVASGGVE